MTAEYRDDLTTPAAFRELWAQVLLVAIADATKGVPRGGTKRNQRLYEIEHARAFLMSPNRDFIEVCSLAGLDPAAVRERAIALIRRAPSAEALADNPVFEPKNSKKELH